MSSAVSEPSTNHVETLLKEKREVELVEPPRFVRIWEESGDYTSFLLRWSAKPRAHVSIARIFIDELRRRRGLRAYGIPVAARRASKVNQLNAGLSALRPRDFTSELPVAKLEAA